MKKQILLATSYSGIAIMLLLNVFYKSVIFFVIQLKQYFLLEKVKKPKPILKIRPKTL